MKKTTYAALGVIAFLITVALGSPYFAVYQIRVAISERNTDALSDHVDFPALRENIKGQIMGGVMDTAQMKANPFADMGRALAVAMIGPVIDSMVSPRGLVALMSRNGPPPESDGHANSLSGSHNYTVAFKGWDKVVLLQTDENSHEGTLTLRRYGLWTWKIISIELPAGALRR